MFVGAVEYPPNHLSVYEQDEYVMWGYSAHRDTLRIEGAADAIASEDARAAVLAHRRTGMRIYDIWSSMPIRRP